jgi:hypothetical protein
MKLYVNGSGHAAAAEAVNPYHHAQDEPRLFYLGRAPHPSNAAVSWASMLGRQLKAIIHNDSEAHSDTSRIIDTTRQWIAINHRWLPETVIMLQWGDHVMDSAQHHEIWQLHQELESLAVRHVFMNTDHALNDTTQHDWNQCYIEPYNPEHAISAWLKSHGHRTVSPESPHFGASAHAALANFLLQYGIRHQLWR